MRNGNARIARRTNLHFNSAFPIPHSALCVPALLALVAAAAPMTAQEWPVHSMERPRPPVVDPGPERPPAPPPSDAIVLFDGKDLSQWRSQDGGAAKWFVRDGYVEVAPGTGMIFTRRDLGDVQLHIEWAAPAPPKGESQDRGNSGVFLMTHYEIQVLDSYKHDTYADGQAAAMYGQVPPIVNACRPPGAWQTYDIVFHRPTFAPDGSVRSAARLTMFHNGVLVHDNDAFTGRTAHGRRAHYEAHGDRLPLALQDHGHPVRYRNVWIRELKE
jgi:3-keto-disaccharide hydrolase